MTRHLRTRVHGDGGVYSVLYALLVLALVGMGALVVDLATLREERRTSRLATDASATAGAVLLNTTTGIQPRAACNQAWSYLQTNLGATGSSPCDSLPTTMPPSCPMSTPIVTGTIGAYKVRITWPVPDNDPLMTNPTVQGGFAQPIDPQADGDTAADPRIPCTRLGVTLTRLRKSTFAGIFGVGSSPVVSSSVARGVPKDGNPPAIAALNVLEQHNCHAVTTSGQGFIQINAVPAANPADPPVLGRINVESDGFPPGGCSPNEFVIDPLNNSLNYIKANGLKPDGTQDVGKGEIRQWALSPAGNTAHAFAPVGTTILAPTPTPMFAKFGSKPVTDRYGTSGDTTTPIGLLVSKFQTGTPQFYPAAQPPWNSAPFVDLPNPLYPNFHCTTQSSDPDVIIPPGNWHVTCPPSSPNGIGLTVANTVIFQGGNIVLDGGIETKSSGCLVVNVSATSCPSSPLSPTGDSIVYVRSGQLRKGATAAMLFPQTFVYLQDGSINLAKGVGALDWSRPAAIGCAADDLPCKYSKFGGLVLWSEKNEQHLLGGQAELNVRGVVFTPQAHFVYDGQPTQNQTEAQFWTRELDVSGQSGLVMAPDPNDAVPSPSSGVALIR